MVAGGVVAAGGGVVAAEAVGPCIEWVGLVFGGGGLCLVVGASVVELGGGVWCGLVGPASGGGWVQAHGVPVCYFPAAHPPAPCFVLCLCFAGFSLRFAYMLAQELAARKRRIPNVFFLARRLFVGGFGHPSAPASMSLAILA